METVKNKKNEDFFSGKIAEKERQKLKALREKNASVWFGLGMMGMVGWSVAVPSLLGAGLGIWLDKKYPESFSWTLSCLLTGLVAGSIIAWYWVAKEKKRCTIIMNKTMNETVLMILAFVAGIILGIIFFGVLWFTVKKSMSSKTPALWVMGSFFFRSSIALLGFYFVGGENWQRLLICLGGFIIARFIVIHFTRSIEEKQMHVKKEAAHEA